MDEDKPQSVEVKHIEPDRYVIEITCDGQSIRFEAPTAEEVIRLWKLSGA